MAGLEFFSLVSVCTFLFVFAYGSFLFVVVYGWLGNTINGWIHFLTVNFIWSCMYYNYIRASTTDPGRVPKNWKSTEIELPIQSDNELIESPSPKVRYCRWCEVEKPPRAHHCSECERCVLKMDHHCIWINNCVGYYNHKYFLLFLVYLVILALYMLIMFVWALIDMIVDTPRPIGKNLSPIYPVLVGVQFMIILPTFLSVACLCGFQMQLVSENTTNIESYEKETEERRAKKKGEIYVYPYNKGCFSNFKDVLGSNLLYWLIPTYPEGDGIHYNISSKSHEV